MNNMEFLYDVKDVTDYIASSTYLMWAAGGAFGSLVDNMAEGKDTKTALSNFVDATVDSWDAAFYNPENPENPVYYDLTLTETKRLDDLAPVLKEFTDRLVNTYQNGTDEQRAAIDECTANAVKVDNTEPFYDMAKYMKSLFTVLCIFGVSSHFMMYQETKKRLKRQRKELFKFVIGTSCHGDRILAYPGRAKKSANYKYANDLSPWQLRDWQLVAALKPFLPL